MAACQATMKDETTEELVPAHKICDCIPQSYKLLLLALSKVVLSLGLLFLLLCALSLFYLFETPALIYRIIIWFSVTLSCIDLGMGVIMCICWKVPTIMKTYYKYSFFILGPLIFMCCVISFIIFIHSPSMVFLLGIFVLICVVQKNLNDSLKNEVLELERSQQIQL